MRSMKYDFCNISITDVHITPSLSELVRVMCAIMADNVHDMCLVCAGPARWGAGCRAGTSNICDRLS